MLKKIILGLVLFLGLCAVGILLFAKDFEVKVSEEMAQEAINAQIKEGPMHSLGMEITLREAKIDFLANNTMKFSADMETSMLNYKHKVDGVFQSGISYRVPRLYLDNLSPVEINIKSDEETKSELDDLKSSARKFLQRQRDNIKSEDNKEALDKIIGKNNEEFQETITAATYRLFERIPIYNLNNAGYKGSLASLALKDVQFSEGYATITLSPVKALLRLLAMLGVALLVITYFLGPILLQRWIIDIIEPDKSKLD